MIDCAIYQACLPGKSDKRNIYPPSSSSKPPVMDEHRAECKINLPNTTISGLESWMKPSFQPISYVIFTTADFKLVPVHWNNASGSRVQKAAFAKSISFVCESVWRAVKEKLQETDFKRGWSPSFWSLSSKSSKSQTSSLHLRAKVPRWNMNQSEVACQAAVTLLSSTGLWTC